ncbi:hypothetical protein Gotri_027125 [Gossypium trilobum]|uniref:Uncharacterized protein n=1 Tax=Gossypium trilobum TaxID=34281 RepID=A0A7J9FP77_9ROSI|nr:hypothetical protein [Gossypium trilobum]
MEVKDYFNSLCDGLEQNIKQMEISVTELKNKKQR